MSLQRSLLHPSLPAPPAFAAVLVVSLGVVLGLVLAGCSSSPPTPEPRTGTAIGAPEAGDQAPDPIRTQVVFTAMQMVGVPYQWGGATPEGFDCSGLVQYVFSSAGLRVPRTAAAQLDFSAPLTLENARAGDLLFFRDGGRTSHVAIYLGQGRFVHAPSSGGIVSLDSFGNAYWRMRFTRAGRVPSSS